MVDTKQIVEGTKTLSDLTNLISKTITDIQTWLFKMSIFEVIIIVIIIILTIILLYFRHKIKQNPKPRYKPY